MVLRNYVELTPGVPATMHFTDYAFDSREIRDPRTGLVKQLNTLVFSVDRLNGVAVGGLYSVSADKLAKLLAPYLPDGAYRGLLFTITKLGSDFLTSYEVQVGSFV
jgi:hypothetical protein